MAPGLLLYEDDNADTEFSASKRAKTSDMSHEDDHSWSSNQDQATKIPSHPLGVRPSGNAFTSPVNSKDNAGGFRHLPDELLFQLLEGLDSHQLLRLGSTCRMLFAFTRADELWRALFVESPPEDFEWRGTWRATYLRLSSNTAIDIACPNVFSDTLHRPFFCTHTPLNHYAQNIPLRNAIPRMLDLTAEEYSTKWTSLPFILTSPVQQWPSYRIWDLDYLLRSYGNVQFRAEAVDWPLKTYRKYMQSAHDESPLYLFDRAFVEKMNIEVGANKENSAYSPPTAFGEDLFEVLGEERPDCRWLIVGPERSGSTFHKDPNATSAWNAPLTGSKYWLMFPSGADVPPPPGVILSDDHSEITSPLSISEYLLSFHAIARATPGCREGICHAGDILHVPSGWFHLVLNLEESIALTQNFVPAAKLSQVLRFLKESPEQASGFKDHITNPYTLFVERLQEYHPKLLEKALLELEDQEGKWVKITKAETGADGSSGGFSFGFASDEDDDVP